VEILFVVIVVVAALWIRQYRAAVRIVQLRSRQLAAATGVSAADIEREIRRRRITPGDWAAEHGLDRLTFDPVETRAGGSVAEVRLAPPDWHDVRALVSSDESRVDACAGWTVSLDDLIHHPTWLFLTDAALYVVTKPQALLPPPSVNRITRQDVLDCGVATQSDGGTRLMIAHLDETSDVQVPQALAVDLRPTPRGRPFAEQVHRWAVGGRGEDLRDYGSNPSASARPQRSRGSKGRLPTRPERS
jgi:hypothetical protein